MLFPLKDWFLLGLVLLTWGINAAMVKIGTNEIAPETLVFLRAFLTGLVFLPFAKKLSFSDFKNVFIVSFVFFTLHYTMMFISIDAINSSSFVVLVMLAMPISIVLSAIFLKETIGIWTIVGIIVSFSGVVVAFGLPDISQYPLGAFMTLITALLWAIGSLCMKLTKNIPLLTFTFYAYILSAPFLLLVTLISNGNQAFHFDDVNYTQLSISLGYQVFVMGFMASVWAYLIGKHRAEFLTPFLLFQILIGAVAGYVLLNEPITIYFVLSGVLIMLGIGIIHYRRLRKLE